MDLKRIGQRAKALVDKRGGADSVKEDAQELKDIAKGPGSVADKAKAAVGAIKDPGDAGEAPATPAAEASGEEAARAGAGGRGRGPGRALRRRTRAWARPPSPRSGTARRWRPRRLSWAQVGH